MVIFIALSPVIIFPSWSSLSSLSSSFSCTLELNKHHLLWWVVLESTCIYHSALWSSPWSLSSPVFTVLHLLLFLLLFLLLPLFLFIRLILFLFLLLSLLLFSFFFFFFVLLSSFLSSVFFFLLLLLLLCVYIESKYIYIYIWGTKRAVSLVGPLELGRFWHFSWWPLFLNVSCSSMQSDLKNIYFWKCYVDVFVHATKCVSPRHFQIM